MTADTIKIGTVEILALSDCVMDIDACEFFLGKSFVDMEPHRTYVEDDCHVKGGINVGVFLVEGGSQTILVDSGLGPGPFGSLGGIQGNLLEEMRRFGVDPLDIDVVITTHLHFDHIGWLVTVKDGCLIQSFPNAEIIVPEADWNLLVNPAVVEEARDLYHFSTNAISLLRESIDIAKNIGEFCNINFTRGEYRVSDEIVLLPTPGHTPGHQSVLITSLEERAFVTGDLIHLPMQIEVPDWIANADVQPELGIKTRLETLDWLAREGIFVASGHFPAPGFGRIVQGTRRRYWEPL